MPGLLIIAHAPLASSLKTVAQHAFPESARILEALDVEPDAPIEDTEARARVLLERVRDPEALVLTDVFGATPSNVAQRLADVPGVKILAGVNVPMLWRSLCYAGEPLEVMAMRALTGATQGVMQVSTSRPQNQDFRAGGDDQEHYHHQQ